MPGLLDSRVASPAEEANRAALPKRSLTSRYINANGDYEIDQSTGSFRRMSAVEHRVLLALRTVVASANSDLTLGMKRVAKVTSRFEAEMAQTVAVALQSLVSEGTITLDAVTPISTGMGRYVCTIEFTDVKYGKKGKVTV